MDLEIFLKVKPEREEEASRPRKLRKPNARTAIDLTDSRWANAIVLDWTEVPTLIEVEPLESQSSHRDQVALHAANHEDIDFRNLFGTTNITLSIYR